MGINAALINLAIQSFTLPRSFGYFNSFFETLNPVLLEERSGPLQKRIELLKAEIDELTVNRSKINE